MKRNSGFTLIELLTCIMIIAVLAALIIKGAGYAQNHAARSRATGEIAALSVLLEHFKTEVGAYPSSTITDALDPTVAPPPSSINPNNYQLASATMAAYLFGANALANTTQDPTSLTSFRKWKAYGSFPDSSFSSHSAAVSVELPYVDRPEDDEDAPTTINVIIRFPIDPFGNAYGYSTKKTFDPSYDIWSYGGKTDPTPDGLKSRFGWKNFPAPWWITSFGDGKAQ